MSAENAVTRSLHFFSTRNWKATSQSARAVTFEGKPPIPWLMILLTIVGFMACLIPGIIMYIMIIRKMYRFMNLVVSAESLPTGSEVSVQFPQQASDLVDQFLATLPKEPAEAQ